eukprot:scaffold71902_cov61-Phaeocystis_antarctica.AAC.2
MSNRLVFWSFPAHPVGKCGCRATPESGSMGSCAPSPQENHERTAASSRVGGRDGPYCKCARAWEAPASIRAPSRWRGMRSPSLLHKDGGPGAHAARGKGHCPAESDRWWQAASGL